jgi:uncharacterized protein (TIGR02466 family)
MKSENYNLFPELIYSCYLNRGITEQEKNFTIKIAEQTLKNTNNVTSFSKNVLENQSLLDIKNFINANLINYVNTIICPKYEIELYITESWLNYTNNKESHHTHNHKNSYLSGVFYFNTVENDKIIFHKNKETDFFEFESKDMNIYNSSSWSFPVKTGQLILFKSNILHSVPVNLENKTRISLAFNTFLKGKINSSFTSELNIKNTYYPILN